MRGMTIYFVFLDQQAIYRESILKNICFPSFHNIKMYWVYLFLMRVIFLSTSGLSLNRYMLKDYITTVWECMYHDTLRMRTFLVTLKIKLIYFMGCWGPLLVRTVPESFFSSFFFLYFCGTATCVFQARTIVCYCMLPNHQSIKTGIFFNNGIWYKLISTWLTLLPK